ncbi:MAG: pyridoxamine 5'-phosphate oxidase family protein [Acidimicrobiia bacterium]
MPRSPIDLSAEEVEFLTARHLATLSTLRPDGTPHVVAIAFSFDGDDGIVRVITSARSQKARNVERAGRAAVCQVDGPRWLTLEGPAVVTTDPERVAVAVAGFERRYRPARDNPERAAIEITVERVLGRA